MIDKIHVADGFVKQGDRVWIVSLGIRKPFMIYKATIGKISFDDDTLVADIIVENADNSISDYSSVDVDDSFINYFKDYENAEVRLVERLMTEEYE